MNSTLLRLALWANAAFSTVTGLLIVREASVIASGFGLGSERIVAGIGAGLIAIAALVGSLGAQRQPSPRLALFISVADVSWVLGTVGLLAVHPPQRALLAITLGNDAVVLAFAGLQLLGIARLFRAADQALGAHRVCIEVETPVAPGALWAVVADLGGISRHMPALRRSGLRDGASPAVGAVRECESVAGQTWAERCTAWDPAARQFAVEFDAAAPGFPYPFRTMRGGWAVRPSAGGSTVQVWWATTPRAFWEAPLVLAFMEASVRRDFPAVVHSMARAAGAPQRSEARHALAACC
jgi:hypothetical protein